MIIDNVR